MQAYNTTQRSPDLPRIPFTILQQRQCDKAEIDKSDILDKRATKRTGHVKREECVEGADYGHLERGHGNRFGEVVLQEHVRTLLNSAAATRRLGVRNAL